MATPNKMSWKIVPKSFIFQSLIVKRRNPFCILIEEELTYILQQLIFLFGLWTEKKRCNVEGYLWFRDFPER